MYCTKCGNQISDEAVICPRCGCIANKTAYDAAFNAVSQEITQNNIYSQSDQNKLGYSPNVQEDKDVTNIAFCVLSFFLPFFGIILYAADHRKAPKSTKKYLICSLINIGLIVIFYILYIAFFIIFTMNYNGDNFLCNVLF